MIVFGLKRAGSRSRWRSWSSFSRAPTPRRSGARFPWNRSSGKGPLWQRRQRPSCRLATMALPFSGSPAKTVVVISNPTTALHHRNPMVLQWDRTNALPSGLVVRVEHRGRRDADRRLADATPRVTAAFDDDRLHARHLRDAHRVVLVEVGLDDAAVLHRALLHKERRQAVDERSCHLPLDLRRVDG